MTQPAYRPVPPQVDLPALDREVLRFWKDRGIFEKKAFQEIHDQAFDEADERFASEDKNDDHNDAFRHAYWNALMADEYGTEAVRRLDRSPPGRWRWRPWWPKV